MNRTWSDDRDDALIAEADGPFKLALDRYKYPGRYEDADPVSARTSGLSFLRRLDARLASDPYLSGANVGMTDIAIFPFVRQFAATDSKWFAGQPLTPLQNWLASHVQSEAFATVMHRYPRWCPEDDPVTFPI